jgi:hypothetical protein
LPEPTAEPWPAQLQIFTQHIKERYRGIVDGYRDRLAVYGERDGAGDGCPPSATMVSLQRPDLFELSEGKRATRKAACWISALEA